jgi:DNA-directed RNA polymerase subunit omega
MTDFSIEKCLSVIPNRFELVLVAIQRARELTNGATSLHEAEKGDKNTVIALSEISDRLLNVEDTQAEFRKGIKNQVLFRQNNLLEEHKKEFELVSNDSSVKIDANSLFNEVLDTDDLDEIDTEVIGEDDTLADDAPDND